ncbi:MAG: cob(I)yrinic acid a,c-diamide adenosyltransferase [Nanoarchaeota archaeon]|nr:cob(I)yrinic acid a,c-diamide adenosyltransferase [Nanoarchaeota archaeon]
MNIKQGLVYVFTGEGKGKTSAALGVAVRAVCAGMKVGWVSWYKEKVLPSRSVLEGKLEMYAMGKGFYKLPGDKATPEEHKQAAAAALKQAEKLLKTVDVLVLDEVNNAVSDKLINLKQVIDLINKRGKTHLILTGRNACPELVERADLVTECKKIKHPFDRGVKAVRGLDY